jgi:cobalamin 5'-phosphate synthase/cobalamin synthase
VGGGIALRVIGKLALSGLHACIAAFQFLTRFPLPVRLNYTDAVFRRSIVFYPFVGAVIGLLLTLAGAGLRVWVPSFPAAVILLTLWVVMTGALHLDGLMDTADGILSHRPREQMLEIMKDSRVGAMGVIVCVLYLLLKVAFIMELIDGSWRHASVFFFCVPIWSRWFMTLSIVGWPYARTGTKGMGAFLRQVRLRHVIAGFAGAFVLTLGALWIFGFYGLSLWLYALGFPAVSGLLGWLMAQFLHRKLGGLTGDTYGAINELLEMLLLFGAMIVWN